MIGKVSDILSHHYDDYIAFLTADKPRDVSFFLSLKANIIGPKAMSSKNENVLFFVTVCHVGRLEITTQSENCGYVNRNWTKKQSFLLYKLLSS